MDEDPKTESVLPKVESIISKKENNPSLTEKITELANQKLDSNFELKDNKSTIELRKLIMDDLKINPNSRGMVRDTLKKVFIDRKLQISDLGFKNEKIGDMAVNVVKSETKPETTPELTAPPQKNTTTGISPFSSSSSQIQSTNRGVLPKTTTEQQEINSMNLEPEQKFMSESAQKRLIENGLVKLVYPLYTAMGIVELDDSEKEDESKIPKGKQFKKDLSDLSTDINDYLVENQIHLPALLNHLSIVLSIFMVLVVPVVKFKFFSSKQDAKPDYDKSAEEVQVKS